MQAILAIAKNLKLSLEQWVFLLLAGAIGVLVVLFRIQGGRLHEAQVSLLLQQLDSTLKQQDLKIANARRAYEDAVGSYHNASNE